jgi:hypothetical protein
MGRFAAKVRIFFRTTADNSPRGGVENPLIALRSNAACQSMGHEAALKRAQEIPSWWGPTFSTSASPCEENGRDSRSQVAPLSSHGENHQPKTIGSPSFFFPAMVDIAN